MTPHERRMLTHAAEQAPPLGDHTLRILKRILHAGRDLITARRDTDRAA